MGHGGSVFDGDGFITATSPRSEADAAGGSPGEESDGELMESDGQGETDRDDLGGFDAALGTSALEHPQTLYLKVVKTTPDEEGAPKFMSMIVRCFTREVFFHNFLLTFWRVQVEALFG